MSPRNDPVSPVMTRSRDPGKGDRSKEEMAEAADAVSLVDGKGGWGWAGRTLGWSANLMGR